MQHTIDINEDFIPRTSRKPKKILKEARTTVDTTISIEMLQGIGKSACNTYLDEIKNILTDYDRPYKIRNAAALLLLRASTSSSISALQQSLNIPHPVIQQTILISLGYLGNPQTLVWLDEQKIRGNLRQAFSWARSLIAYRHGLSGYSIRLPRNIKDIDLNKGDRQTVLIKETNKRHAEKIIKEVELDIPNINLTFNKSIRFTCGPREYIYLWNKHLLKNNMIEKLQSTKTLTAIIAERFVENPGHAVWGMKYLIMTHPKTNPTGILILVSTRNGKIIYRGFGQSNDGKINIKLNSLKVQGAVPLKLSGSLKGMQLNIDKMISGTVRYGKKEPKPLNKKL